MPPIISNQIKPDRDEVAKYSKEGNGDGGDAFEVELHHHLPTLAHCQSRNCFWMSAFEFNICRFARFYTTTGGVLGVFLVLKSHIVTITVQAKVHTYKIDWKITFLFVCICAVAKHTFPRYGLEKGLRVVYMFTVHSTCFRCLLYLYVVNFVLSTLHLLLATASRLDYAFAAYTRQGTRIQINKHPSKLLISLSRPCWYIFWETVLPEFPGLPPHIHTRSKTPNNWYWATGLV